MDLFHHRRSQVSFETMICIGAVLFLFILISALCLERESYIRQTRSYVDLRDSCQKLANLITETYASGEGTTFSTTIYNPADIMGSEGSLVVYDNSRKNEAYCNYPLKRVSNTTHQDFSLHPGLVNFRFNEETYLVEVTQ